jgi:putative Mg2+ transporter-C (MgtC) family protein
MILDGLLEPALRLAAAVFAGGIVGLNRDLHGKPTGVRAHALVAFGAALFVMSSTELGIAGSDGNIVSRVIQGVVGGIGFLGAGVILRSDDGRRIFHVATAASIWVTAALGVACGLGAFRLILLSIIAVAMILVVGARIDHALYGKLGREDDQ